MLFKSDPKVTCAKTWKITAAQATYKNNYYNLQVDKFVNLLYRPRPYAHILSTIKAGITPRPIQ